MPTGKKRTKYDYAYDINRDAFVVREMEDYNKLTCTVKLWGEYSGKAKAKAVTNWLNKLNKNQ